VLERLSIKHVALISNPITTTKKKKKKIPEKQGFNEKYIF
jgi:hypothetical protein